MANKRGRKRKSGERYPSGDLKPEIAPTLWARMRDLHATSDPILKTELSRLSFHGKLSDAQTLAGFYIGDIYHQFCSYEDLLRRRNWGNSFNGTEPRLNSRQPLLFSTKDMREEEWRTIENEVEALSRNLRNAVLDLCVFNEPINPTIYPEVCVFLDRIANLCEADWSRYEAREPRCELPKARPSTPVVSEPLSDYDVIREAFKEMLFRLVPDLTPEEVSGTTNMLLAFRDREDFRQEKLADGKTSRRESQVSSSRARKE